VRTIHRAALATAAVLALAVLVPRAGDRPPPRTGPPTARAIRVLPPDSVIAGPILEQRRVGAYLLQIIHDTVAGDRIADVKLNGHRVFAVRAADVRFDPAGRDITGDRVPDVVVHQFSGGAHCCSRATVLSLGREQLLELGSFDGGHGDVELEDVNGDGVSEIKVGDWRFAYWRDYPFGDTEVPEVLFRYRDGRYQVACDLMRQAAPPPDAAELHARARELTDGWVTGDPPAEFWGFAVDLVYRGQADLAFSWLESSWPASVSGRAEFLRDLREKLRGSPCWSPPTGPQTT